MLTCIYTLLSGIKCTLRKFAKDTRLCGAVDTLEGRDVILRDLDRLERWGYANLMKFNKVKCNVLHLSQGDPKHNYGLDRYKYRTESSPVKKDFSVG
ncbi:rna-directed dna polymerase from mobile element jockey-like [Pitangus sulphuratus]|nr:rna-directed dna polymerase from mobile element jockey-like [Pitangus sulphuratus]